MASVFSAKELKQSPNEMAAEITETSPPVKDVESAFNDPDFAVICAFLQKFAKDVGVILPNFNSLHQWLLNTDEVSQPLREMHIKLLRKIRRTVHEKCWEVPLSKFCFSYSAQDAWEIERFGYKKSSLKVKLRVLRHLLECQFERNNKFRSKLLTQSADSLRSQPIGRDKLGHTYWLTQDDDCNLRIYQEHLDEEIWRVVASNREELVNLITRLRGNEVVLPSEDIGIIDEDTSSSSVSCNALVEKPPPPEEQDDSQEEPPALKVPNLRIKLCGNKKTSEQECDFKEKTPNEEQQKQQTKAEAATEKAMKKESDDSLKKVKPLIIQQSQIGGNSPNSSNKRKANNDEEEAASSSPTRDEQREIKRPRPSLLDSRRASKPNKYFKPSKGEEDEEDEEYESSSLDGESELADEEECEEEDIDSAAAEEGENEEKDIEEFDDSDDDDGGESDAAVGTPIEDPPIHIRENGAGKECDAGNPIDEAIFPACSAFDESETDEIVGETIEEEILYVYGAGAGQENLVGNKTEESETTPSHEPKATFFFGEPGCLKLSPIKAAPTTPISPTKSTNAEEEKATVTTETDEKSNDKQADEETEIEEKRPKSNDVSKENTVADEVELKENSSKLCEPASTAEELNGDKDKDKITKDLKDNVEEKAQTKNAEDAEVVTSKEVVIVPNHVKSNEENETTLDDKTKTTASSIKSSVGEEKESNNETEAENVKKVIILEKPTLLNETTEEALKTSTTKTVVLNAPSTSTTAKAISTTPITPTTQQVHFNRKRRLTDFSKPAPPPVRHSTSESDFDTQSDQQADNTAGDDNDKDVNEDIGGKRLKIRPKCTNTEARKKVEAQLVEKKLELEETTSSSGDEEARRPRKMITPKRNVQKANFMISPPTIAAMATVASQKTKAAEHPENTNTQEEKKNMPAATLPSLPPPPLIKTKPTLSEIIEKKLKKTPPKPGLDIFGDAVTATPTTSSETIFSLPKKSPITKPLKKNLLTQLRESDDEAVPRKRTISETVPGAALAPKADVVVEPKLNAASTVETSAVIATGEATIDILKADCERTTRKTYERVTPERQRKRQNSEEACSTKSLTAASDISKVERESTTRKTPERVTPERQRKRQNSEETSSAKLLTASSSGSTDDNCNGKENTNSVKKSKENSVLEKIENVKKAKEESKVENVASVENYKKESKLEDINSAKKSKEESQIEDDVVAKESQEESKSEDKDIVGVKQSKNVSPPKEKAAEKKADASSAKIDVKSETEPMACSEAGADKKEDDTSPSVGGRRSSRRCAASVVYAELPKPKRTRGGGAKTTPIKKEKSEEPNDQASQSTEPIAAKTEAVKSPERKSVAKTESAKIEKDAKNSETTVEKAAKTKSECKVKAEKGKTAAVNDDNIEDEIKTNIVQKAASREEATEETPEKKTSPTTNVNESATSTTGRGRGGGRKQREVDMTNIIEANDNETPVRQSRRIAQQKIREEAERRKLEEIALRTMKQELKKKKKAEKEADPTVVEPLADSSSSSGASSESEPETKRKSKKKCPGKDGWSSGSEEEDEPEEEEEHPPHYDTDPGSPLFKSDHEFSPESDLEDETQVVPMKRARTLRKEDADDDEDQIDEQACQKCGKSDHPEWILLCDNCDKGYHCSCLSPVLFYIPEGNWYCPPCQQTQLIAALEKQLKEFDELVERKRIEHAEEKRLAEEAERQEQARLKEEEEQRKERRKQKQKKRHRSADGDSSAESSQSGEDKSNKDKEGDVSGKQERDSEDDEQEDGKKAKASKQSDKVDAGDKHKRRRGEGRNRRRKAATRGTRRRRRLDKDSDSSATGSNSSSGGSGSGSGSGSSSSESDSFSDSDDEPIYKLRKRRQINVSYRLNEYDDLINSALKKEMDEAAGAGNLGRGKDISTIIEADKEEKARLKGIEEKTVAEALKTSQKESSHAEDADKDDVENAGEEEKNEDDEEVKPAKPKAKPKPTLKKKPRKLTTLDISSEDDGSDEDFKTSSFDDDDDEEDTLVSASEDSDTSLEIYRRRGKGGKKKQRKAARRAARQRRKDRRFVVENSDDDEEQVAKPKKKRKEDSDYTETETDDDDLSENSENIDSADLCDDTTSDSDGAWHPSKRKKQRKSGAAAPSSKPKPKKPQNKKPKQLEYSDDDISETEEEEDDDDEDIGGGKGSGKQPRSQPLIPVKSSKNNAGKGKGKGNAGGAGKKKPKKKKSEDEVSFSSGSDDSARARTRGRRYAYIEDFDDDSSDGGIKPGVHRPDTPPEEREKFIKKQEEIKRMLAEKNAEGAKLAATPRLTPIKAVGQVALADKDKRSPAKQDSLSTVPLSVIRQAKVLDIDYLQRKGGSLSGELDNADEDVDSEFDDADLPDDLPEDMDEDAIARMVEEEEGFGAAAAVRELPPPDEILRTPTKSKTKDVATSQQPSVVSTKTGGSAALEALAQMQGGGGVTTAQASNVQTPHGSGLQEPTRKRLPMPTFHPPLLRHQYPHPPHTQSGNMMLHGGVQHIPRHGPPTHLLQNALSAPLGQPLNRNFGLPHGHNAGPPMPARQLLPPSRPPLSTASAAPVPALATDSKPRGRRKKITPLRDNAQKQATAASAAAATAAAGTPTDKMAPSLLPTPPQAASTVIKSPSTSTLSIAQPPQLYKPPTEAPKVGESQPSVITRMPHLPPPNRMIFPGADVARFYSSLTSSASAGLPRSLPSSNSQRPHRGPPLQMPPGLGPPPSGYGPPHSARHPPPHLNPYRPPIYGNPSYGQPRPMPPTGPNLRLGAPPTSGPDYISGARPYPPYAYYPPPPPLTTAHHPQPPPVSSVIVAAPPSSVATTHAAPISMPPNPSNHSTATPKPALASHTNIKRVKSPLAEDVLPPAAKKSEAHSPTPPPSQKKLMTLDVYEPSSAKSPVAMGGGESSGSQPETAEDSPTATTASSSQSKVGEFSGLVSYFSSQHDDYNS